MELRQRRSDAKQPDLGDDSSDPIGEPAAKPVANRGVYTTGLRACLAIVMGARVLSALLNLIHDCDEVYNYWEPLHFLVYGSGFKTWEYSSKFALRSWLYIYCHALVAYPLSALLSPTRVFYAVRLLLGLLSGVGDCALLVSFDNLQWTTNQETRLLAVFLGVSPGLFVSSTSFLPSSFAQALMSFAMALTLQKRGPAACVMACVAAVLPCWPFVGLAAVPIGLVFLFGQPIITIVSVIFPFVVILGIAIPLDYAHFGRLTFPHLNLIFYNSSSSSLYGTEPASYYWKNLVLNFNLILPFSLLGCVIIFSYVLFSGKSKPSKKIPLSSISDAKVVCATASIFPLWLGFMMLLPHKEERFLYPVYQSICISSSIGLSRAVEGVSSSRIFSKRLPWLKRTAIALVVGVIILLSTLRIDALLLNYGGSLKTWRVVHELTTETPSKVCVGKEWYRFTSSFFIAKGSDVYFYPDGFDGLLPGAFADVGADLWLNDRNIGMIQAYAVNSTLECDLVVDFVPTPVSEDETILYATDFLIAEKSSVLSRILSKVPGRRTFGSYVVKKAR